MTEKQMHDQAAYLATMKIAQDYLKRGIITEEQYGVFDTRMTQKYNPFFGDLFPRNTLTSEGKRVIYVADKEVDF